MNRKRTGNRTSLVRRRTPWAISRSGTTDLLDRVRADGPPRPQAAARSLRRPAGPDQELERELRARDHELVCAGASETRACVYAKQQPSVLDQIQTIDRRKAPALRLPVQCRPRTPEHRQPLGQRRTLCPFSPRHGLDPLDVSRTDRISDDQSEVDIAYERAEAAVGKAAERVRSNQPFTQRDLVSPCCLQQ